MAHEKLTDTELTQAREDALDAFSRAAAALEALFNDLAVMHYPSGEYAVRHAQMPALKANLLAKSSLFTSLHNELDRRERERASVPADVPMVCTACRKPATRIPGTTAAWWHVEIDDYMACPATSLAVTKVMVAAGNENIPVAPEFAR